MSKLREYTAQGITVTFDPRRCIHSAECVKGLPQVFDSNRKPWIDPGAAAAEEIAAVIHRCPTGALHYRRTDASGHEDPPATNEVRIGAAGPLYLRARTTVVDPDGNTIVQDSRIALCRCGQSENKPFCDGRHTSAGFSDPGKISAELEDIGESPVGDLEIKALANGPLLCAGRFAIVDGDGNQVAVREKAAFCRCGQSGNKPFCDGTHNKIGFNSG